MVHCKELRVLEIGTELRQQIAEDARLYALCQLKHEILTECISDYAGYQGEVSKALDKRR